MNKIRVLGLLSSFISRWMAVIVLVVAVGAMLFPEAFGVIKTSWITWLLCAVMFGMGLTLNVADFRMALSRPKDICIGFVAQFFIMPFLAYALAKVFSLPPELAVGVVLVGCCPGGTSSNVITYLAGGDIALSVCMTSVSTLLAPFMTPLLIWLIVGEEVHVDLLSMFVSILQVVIAPIVLGLLVKRIFHRALTATAEREKSLGVYLSAFSTLAITCIVAAVVASNAEKLQTCGLVVIAVVVLHNLLGFVLGYLLARALKLGRTKCITVSVEVGMQNSGLACSLAQQHFQSLALATVPGAIFSVWHNIAGALLARVLQRTKNESHKS